MPDVEVTLAGPLFDGRAERILGGAIEAAEEAVARSGQHAVRALVGRRAMHPTGNYASRTVIDRSRANGSRVHTPGLRYTAWLEGKAKRNARSRFKGYHLYRDAQREAEARTPAVAGEVIGKAVREING